MERPVCYDVTRLLTRILNPTPNGIDRIDFALAEHFLGGTGESIYGATATGVGARLLTGPAASDIIKGIAKHWRETRLEANDDPVYLRVRDWLKGTTFDTLSMGNRRRRIPQLDIGGIASWLKRHGVPVRKTPRRHLPLNSVYINTSQFPLWVAGSFEWLEARPDVKAAFFIHDLLPVLLPEYFPVAELDRHRRRLRNFARFGAAAIVTTKTVAADLATHVATLGRTDVPIFVAHTPVSPTFVTPRVIEPALAEHPYLVLCSTIEPRKNHLMILAVWRTLVQRYGRAAPKLVLVGARGWHFTSIVDLIERSPALHGHVIEVGGLSTPGLKRLIDNAQAVLMPTFGEGYGLPVHEALAAGAPVVASDIPVFREIEDERLTLLSPLNGEAWLETIVALSSRRRGAHQPSSLPGWSAYFTALDAFLTVL